MVSIFNTTLTLAELEKALQQSLQTESTFGHNVKFDDLGDGNGIITQVGLLTPDWTPADSSVPPSFAVKVSAPKTATKENQLAELINETMSDEKAKSMIKYHNAEIDIYEKFKEHKVILRMPKMYACKKRASSEDSGYIILEHYEGIASGIHMNDNVTSETIETIIEQLVKLHKASALFSPEEQHAMKGEMFQDTFNCMFVPEMLAKLSRLVKEFGGDGMAAEAREMETVLDEMADPVYLKFLDDTSEILGLPRLLCHGDVWMCNMLWERKPDGLEFRALIDFQGAQFNSPAADLVRLFTGCLSGKARRKNWEGHMKYWWELMSNGEEIPFTLEQIKEAYYRFFPGCAFIVAGSIASVGQMIVDQQPDEENKEKAKESLREKQLAMLQDIIFYHKRNMDLISTSTSKPDQ